MLREEKAAIGHGGTHPFAAFAHGGVRQPDERHPFQTAGNVDFYMDRFGVQADNCATMHFGKHEIPRMA